MELATIVVVIVEALVFDYTNGFHDAANAIATSVATRALTPRVALVMAAVMNLVGAFLGTEVASTVGSGIIDPPQGISGLVVVLAALVGAIIWNLITWWFGMPSSSSHALIGGLVGAALAAAGTVHWSGVLDKVVIPMVLATPSDTSAPSRFITAASSSATLGVSARVEIDVAMALAASWKPLV